MHQDSNSLHSVFLKMARSRRKRRQTTRPKLSPPQASVEGEENDSDLNVDDMLEEGELEDSVHFLTEIKP